MPSPPDLLVAGLDTQGQQIVDQRSPIVHANLSRWLAQDNQSIDLLMPQRRSECLTWFQDFERRITRFGAADVSDLDNGRFEWIQSYTLPLAIELGLIQVVETVILRSCLRMGLFDTIQPEQPALLRPQEDNVFHRVRMILADTPHINRRIEALVDQRICRDTKSAGRVIDEIRRLHIRTAGLARGIVLAYIEHGEIGLLVNSEYPCVQELLLLEQQLIRIKELTTEPEAVLAMVRADITALYKATQSVHPALWQQRLLHEPVISAFRAKFQKNIRQEQTGQVITALIQERQCDQVEATKLWETLLTGGLLELIAWRCEISPEQIRRILHHQRIRHALVLQFGILAPEDRKVIESLLDDLQAAIDETGVSFPLVPLLRDYPSSYRRIRIGRRFWFGVPAIVKRRQQRAGRKRNLSRFRSGSSSKRYRDNKSEDSSARQLVAAFSRLTRLEETDIRRRLRDFITYGPLGLLPKNLWAGCIDERLVSWLTLIKLGRLPGRVPWENVIQQLNTYGRELGQSGYISSPLARTIFNSTPKQSYWHGGQGEAVATVRQRGTVVISSSPRLHATWIIEQVVLPFALMDSVGHQISDHCNLLLVIDKGSDLPIGGWIGEHAPDAQMVGLALYQSIWHPGVLYWPLRGIPEIIQIPESLVAGGMENLQRAASFLLTEMDVIKKPLRDRHGTRTLIRELQADGVAHLQSVLNENQRTSKDVLRELLGWFYTHCFPNHRSPQVPASIREHGVAMPGHNTPAAGWLLPIVEAAITMRDSVIYHGQRYTSPWFRSPPDQKLHLRAFPFFYPALEGERVDNTIFVEIVQDNGVIRLHSLRHK